MQEFHPFLEQQLAIILVILLCCWVAKKVNLLFGDPLKGKVKYAETEFNSIYKLDGITCQFTR